MIPSTLYIASDHAGHVLKTVLVRHLENTGWKVEDLGAPSTDSADYPDYAHALCRAVLEAGHKGILICGTGIGMCMAANRHRGIRAALCTHEFQACSCRGHNDANVLCLAERITAPALACVMVDTFLETQFAGGRHQRRIELIENIS